MSRQHAPMKVKLQDVRYWLALCLLLACGKRSYGSFGLRNIPDLLCNTGIGTSSLLNLGCMVECMLHIEPISRYVNYGCWCGFGGAGEPIDNIDRCCQSHDLCYDQALKKGSCTLWQLYTTWYWWRCTEGYPSCLGNQIDTCFIISQMR
ncbi:hypothetical protein D918_07737 [Trichuris suis]|nr:hypothetical protein D918_07737 [Trichuris suis]